MNARLALLALALLAGCKNTSTRPTLRLQGPAAVAVFKAYTAESTELRTLFAVANERGDDLRFLDAVDGKAVLAPALVQALSVPTAPRPSLLAAGGLFDTDLPGVADLLAVASTGEADCDPAAPGQLSACVQIVATWSAATAIAPALTVAIADAIVLSLAVVPVPEPDGLGGFRPAAGRARVVAGLSGGRLLLADYARAADGASIELAGAAVHALGFDPQSLSASPDRRHLYAASLDPIVGVSGVAELDLAGAFDQAPPVRAIAAPLPTTHVLAATVRPFVALGTDPKLDQHGPEVIRVWAALDPDQCGRDRDGHDFAVPCGLAVLDPVAGGPLPDPAGELPYHRPIAFPGRAASLAAVYPPSLGGLEADGTTPEPGDPVAFQKQATATSFRWTSTLAAVATTTGAVYLLDLARGAPALDRSLVETTNAGTQARVSAVQSSAPLTSSHPRLALWDRAPVPPVLTFDSIAMTKLVTMTLGYTGSDAWRLAFEDELPGLRNLPAQVQATGGALAWLAVQASSGTNPDDVSVGPFRDVGRLYDPGLFLHPGDIAVVTPANTDLCPLGTFELVVTGFLAPDGALYPGGAVTVTPRPPEDQPQVESNGQKEPADPHCLDGVTDDGGRSTARVTFRAGGLLLTGSFFGYAGRPVARDLIQDATGAPYRLAWEDTSALTCAIPEDGSWPPPACDQACRDTCERIALARRARRATYVAEQCAATDTTCQGLWKADPIVNPVGPVLEFTPGLAYGDGVVDKAALARGATLTIATSDGQVVAQRRPLSGTTPNGAVLPAGMVTFDRTAVTGTDAAGVRVFVAYPASLVLDFSPSQAASVMAVYR